MKGVALGFYDIGNAEGSVAFAIFSADHETHVLTGKLNRLFATAGIFVAINGDFGDVARAGVSLADGDIEAALAVVGNG